MLTIQNGDYTINVALISEIDWTIEGEATVTMVTGIQYTLEGEDLAALKTKITE
jgi:hypothetical protein